MAQWNYGTIAFGQRFEVTPIQMITMVSTIANGGVYIHPRAVKSVINTQTGERTEMVAKKGDRVISEEVSKNVLSMMGTVVSEGTGKNAQVKGFSIGGKTGTSEDGVHTGKYVTSFIGVATVENPTIAILIVLYNPTGEGGHQGGGVAAPIASQVLGEVLPYLELKKDKIEEEIMEEVNVPNITGLSIKEAENMLKELGLEIQINEEIDKENTIIQEQIPQGGVKVNRESKIIIKY